jgi:TM2 domain-containing membrane protein YozV
MIKYQDGDKDVFEQKQPYNSRNAYQQHGSSGQYNASFNRKSPGLAFLFSFLYPGIGQFYNGQIGKGVTMTIMGTTALVTGAVCAANAVEESYGYGGYYETTDETMLLIASTAYVVYFGTWLWSFIDAPVSAGKINRRRERGELSWNIGNESTLSLNPNLQYATALNGATLRRQPACGLSLTLNF